ncbi:hypothetical protein GCM10017744_079630 [Streptomyces antimycoticus]|uniref:Uncharacterized protein n=1 Tax=Streptomyces antimycoticus TaxID=68175 RepID=A0A4D4K2I1_9ACTN|nr:hypothetical protein [Streptomyces antimycoticus]GDY41290.1 hypothetical protein SANT12839_021720 [Streptomyces antimycoticus]
MMQADTIIACDFLHIDLVDLRRATRWSSSITARAAMSTPGTTTAIAPIKPEGNCRLTPRTWSRRRTIRAPRDDYRGLASLAA